MKMFLTTTAMVMALSLPNLVSAQTDQTQVTQTAGGQQTEMTGFLSTRDASDLFVSELMGHDVYARRAMGETTGTAEQTTAETTTSQTTEGQTTDGQAVNGLGVNAYAARNSDGTSNLELMTRADLESLDNIGQVTEIVLSNDGQVRAIVIGVGGFLGMGEQDVAVTMDQVVFGANPEDRSEMFIVVNTNAEMLKASPAYDRMAMAQNATTATDGTDGNATTAGNRTPFTAPAMKRDGYTQMAVTEVSSEMLVGKAVYGVNDMSVGTIDDLILDDKGAISNVIIDFGGFLGMGTSQVSVGFDELTIIADDGRADVRIYVDATKEQVQAQPPYLATN